ncbi:MAG: hypothetical protein ABWK01_07665 [Infirmifilum sp.]
MDISTNLSTVAVISTVVASSASLGYWLASKFKEVDARFGSIETRLDRLERGVYSYNELRSHIPGSQSKYYTEEVRERLARLLEKDLNDYTMDDVWTLEEIADLMFEEYVVTRRRDLLDYQARLRLFAQVVRIMFVEPKIIKGLSALRPGEKKGQSGPEGAAPPGTAGTRG